MNKIKYSFFNRNIEPFNNETTTSKPSTTSIQSTTSKQLINGNKITINDNDDMTNFVSYKKSNKLNNTYCIHIGNKVTEIPDRAFENIKINELTFKEGSILKKIGKKAFYNSKDNISLIKNLQIPNSVTTICKSAFHNVKIINKNVPLFDVDGSLNTIGEYAFSNSTEYKSSINNLRIPDSVTTINDFAFHNVQIVELFFGENSKLEKIGSFAFSNDRFNTYNTKNRSLINNLGIPSSVTTINESAFQNVQIVELFFRENSKLKEIGKNAFSNNISNTEDRSLINNLKIPSSVTTINESAFQNVQIINDKGVPLFEVDGSLETIGKKAFSNYTDNISLIENLRIPSSVTTIGFSAFGNVQLNNDENTPLFIVDGSLKTIGEAAFSNYSENRSSIVNLQIPGSVETICDEAFENVQIINDENTPLFIVDGSLNTIGSYAFYNYSENRSLINNLQIPDNVDIDGSLNPIGIDAFFEVRYCKTNLQKKYGAIDAKCSLSNEIPFKKIIIFIIVVFFIFIVFIVFKKNINLSF